MAKDPEYVGVAEYDQLHAEAIDALRNAETFFLAVPDAEEEVGNRPIAVRGGGVGFDAFLLTVAAGLNVGTWEAVHRHLQKSRRLRWFMLVTAGLNCALVVYNLARLGL